MIFMSMCVNFLIFLDELCAHNSSIQVYFCRSVLQVLCFLLSDSPFQIQFQLCVTMEEAWKGFFGQLINIKIQTKLETYTMKPEGKREGKKKKKKVC